MEQYTQVSDRKMSEVDPIRVYNLLNLVLWQFLVYVVFQGDCFSNSHRSGTLYCRLFAFFFIYFYCIVSHRKINEKSVDIILDSDVRCTCFRRHSRQGDLVQLQS